MKRRRQSQGQMEQSHLIYPGRLFQIRSCHIPPSFVENIMLCNTPITYSIAQLCANEKR